MQDLLEKLRKKYPNVRSVGMGFKYVGGVRTDRVSIVIGVEKKRPARLLKADEFLPAEIDGIRTDVRELKFRARHLGLEKESRIAPLEYTQRKRPCPGGFSIGHEKITAGTLGGPIIRQGELGVLSNAHVLANVNDGSLGDYILQPGPYDGGQFEADRFAQLEATVAINAGGGGGGGCIGQIPWPPWQRLRKKARERLEQPDPNRVDCAFGKMVKLEDLERVVYRIGPIVGINPALELNQHVRKCGRTTELQAGLVDQLNVSSIVDYGGFYANFTNQTLIIGVAGAFSAPGDSGSWIVNDSNELCGLLFAGGEDESGRDVTLANNMDDVLAYLGPFSVAN